MEHPFEPAGATYPLAQLEYPALPVDEAYVFTAQSLQPVEPVPSWYSPVGHAEHTEVPVEEE